MNWRTDKRYAIFLREGDWTLSLHPEIKVQILYKGNLFWTCDGHPAPSGRFLALYKFLREMTKD